MHSGSGVTSQAQALSAAMDAQAARLDKLTAAAPEPEPEPEAEQQLQLSAAHRSFTRSAVDPVAAQRLAQEAQRLELWHLACNEVVSTRDSVARQLQLASDLCASRALSPSPLIFSYTSEKSSCGAGCESSASAVACRSQTTRGGSWRSAARRS